MNSELGAALAELAGQADANLQSRLEEELSLTHGDTRAGRVTYAQPIGGGGLSQVRDFSVIVDDFFNKRGELLRGFEEEHGTLPGPASISSRMFDIYRREELLRVGALIKIYKEAEETLQRNLAGFEIERTTLRSSSLQ